MSFFPPNFVYTNSTQFTYYVFPSAELAARCVPPVDGCAALGEDEPLPVEQRVTVTRYGGVSFPLSCTQLCLWKVITAPSFVCLIISFIMFPLLVPF